MASKGWKDLLAVVLTALLLGVWSIFTGALAAFVGTDVGAAGVATLGTAKVVLGALLLVAAAGLYARRPWARWLALTLFALGIVIRVLPLVYGRVPPLLGVVIYTGAFLYLLLGADLVESDDGKRRAEGMDPHQLNR